ncbi:PiggyBac transposable element-derived protein 4 [Elysia marginata]|uniref:PiggyBac transposable element-derived protein 4 n=1 Tax=Elysia marginata TaxID=1093978 RepID=A0AAV4GJH1_9GAST|nr:PiggyBac transposable element-derived protein 4 [Elysia marginata]
MDQMTHAFTTKRKTKCWPPIMFFNVLDLASIASRVALRMKYPVDTCSHKDNRQRFNIDIGTSLALAPISCAIFTEPCEAEHLYFLGHCSS